MQPINSFLDQCKKLVKGVVRPIAQGLNNVSGGQLSPNTVTIVGLCMHIPIAWLIAQDSPVWAAGLLVVFGLFDTLDGELARLQKRESSVGMLLDSTTDRMKEIILYIGIAYLLVSQSSSLPWQPATIAAVAAAACGGSILVSYVNAWGEAILAAKGHKHTINQTFRSGLLRFEIRMVLIILGLLTGWLLYVVAAIAVLAWLTALERLRNIIAVLK
ncbi:MAG TPA: CDP-alcohol phosphatidyltransferase family protein [Verrucomicrobiae bacterium]|nr:CDP-alcohol phosphatidyltransferase family protein [Verrucomicrobiae bacterium]